MLSSQHEAQVAGWNDWVVHDEQGVVEGVDDGVGEVAVGEVEWWVVVGEEEEAEAEGEEEGEEGNGGVRTHTGIHSAELLGTSAAPNEQHANEEGTATQLQPPQRHQEPLSQRPTHQVADIQARIADALVNKLPIKVLEASTVKFASSTLMGSLFKSPSAMRDWISATWGVGRCDNGF
ncbi:hypothetical protein ABBQ38_010234 [Trebouxia sp. C0009 RCD-2024]